MNTSEWPLIIFTILGQLAVGAFVLLQVVRVYAARQTNAQEADRMTDRVLLPVVGLLGVGLLASILHLGNPINAPRAIANLASSWLSREIFCSVAFFGMAVLFTAMQLFKWGSAALRGVVGWVGAVIGVGLVFCMARAYMLPTQPSWNSLATPVSFYAASLLMGALALGTAFFANYTIVCRKNPESAECQAGLLRSVMGGLAVLAVVMLGVELVVTPLYLTELAAMGGAALGTVDLMAGGFSTAFVLRLVLGFVGAGVFGLFLFQNARQGAQVSKLGMLVSLAFVLVLAAEVLGRFLFYTTSVHLGI